MSWIQTALEPENCNGNAHDYLPIVREVHHVGALPRGV